MIFVDHGNLILAEHREVRSIADVFSEGGYPCKMDLQNKTN